MYLLRLLPVLALAVLAAALVPGPGPVAADGALVATVDTGDFHGCAVTVAGGLKCWGTGWLGDGADHSVGTLPVDVCDQFDDLAEQCSQPLSAVTAVAAGLQHTCAITAAGAGKCWGWNFWGQLGTEQQVSCPVGKLFPAHPDRSPRNPREQISPASGDGPCSRMPVDVTGLSDAIAITAGARHTCALAESDQVQCWGANSLGQLGDGTGGTVHDFSRTPVSVCAQYDRIAEQCIEVLDDVVALAPQGFFTCALTRQGGVKCWGWKTTAWLDTRTDELCEDDFGRLVPCSTTPVDIPALESDVAEIAPAIGWICVLTTAGGVRCGGGNGLGGLGDGQSCGTVCLVPVDVPGLSSGVVAIASGDSHTCVLTESGGVRCWGTNIAGELGGETTDQCGQASVACSTRPVGVTGLASEGAAVTAGQFFTCALTIEGGAKCWGNNCCGQLGNGGRDPITVPPIEHPVPTNVVGLGPKLAGDVDCQVGVSSIDAALILQYEASLINTLLCAFNGDVNANGTINAVDAALVLQHEAGIIEL